MPFLAFLLLTREPTYRVHLDWLVGIALVGPVVAWFCFRAKNWLRGVGFLIVGTTTIYAAFRLIAAFTSDAFLGPRGPDYSFVGIAFAAAALPLIAARVAGRWNPHPTKLR